MKILIVSTNFSHPTDAGNRAAIMGQVYTLQKMGHEVHFLFNEMSLRKQDYSAMQDFWGDKLHIYNQPIYGKFYRLLIDQWRKKVCHGYWKRDDHYPNGLAKYVNNLQKQHTFDAIIIQYMRLSKLLPAINIPRKAIYTHDVFAYKDIRTGGVFYETCDAHQEAKALQRCPNIFAIQEEEAAYYKMISPKSNIFTVYSNYAFHEQPLTRNKNILFLASRMDFNYNGIKWFLDNVWNKFSTIDPYAKLLIAGTVCENIKAEEYQNIKLLGRIDSLDEFYKQGDIVINPVYQGTGLKIKTFESLSYGKITIVHPHSTNGIFQRDKAPLFIAETPDEWIDTLSQALSGNIDPFVNQKKTAQYISDMSDYITSQYQAFLK